MDFRRAVTVRAIDTYPQYGPYITTRQRAAMRRAHMLSVMRRAHMIFRMNEVRRAAQDNRIAFNRRLQRKRLVLRNTMFPENVTHLIANYI